MSFSAAASKREITPPVGVGLSGFIARYEPSNAVGDALHTRAVVLSDGRERAAIVELDLLGLSPWHVAAIREYTCEQLAIPRDHLLLSVTHTHSGPGMVPLRGCDMASYDYQWQVIEKTNLALKEASERLAPATLEIGSKPYTFGLNRREETAYGVVLGIAPGKPHPTRLEIARIRTGHQQILLFSHACHPYILGADSRLISGDFASQACLDLEHENDTMAVFLNGCAGNIRPIGAFEGFEKAQTEGKRLAEAVQEGCRSLSAVGPDVRLNATQKRIYLPFAPFPSTEEIDEIARKEEQVVQPNEKTNQEVQRRLLKAFNDWAMHLKEVVQLKMPIDPVFCEVQAMRIGPLALAAISGEPFFEIGESVREASSFPVTWSLGYTNAYCGYIATAKEYPLGGYEVEDSFKFLGQWKIDESAEERLVDAARISLARLHGNLL